MVGDLEVVAVHLSDDRLSGLAGGSRPLDFGGASAVARFQVDGEVEGGHLVDFVITTIGPHATHVQGQCATASPGYDSGVFGLCAVLRKRPEGGPARLPLPRRPQGAPAPYARGHFFDRPLAYRA